MFSLHGEGYVENDIDANLYCSKIIVHNAIVKFNAEFPVRKRFRFPRKTTSREDCLVRQ